MSDLNIELESIRRLTEKLYAAICFNEGEEPPISDLLNIFTPDGKMINIDGDHPVIFTVDQYIKRFKDLVSKGTFTSFHEMELSHQTEIFGKISHRFSTYETRIKKDDPTPYSRGINSIQMVKNNGSWYITSLLWNKEGDGIKIQNPYI